MCFSMQASFASSLILFIISFLSFRKIRYQRQLLLVAIPFMFAIQQFAEGFVWASINYNWPLEFRNIFSYIFLFFAFGVWPTLIPLAVYFYEKNSIAKKILKIIFYFGIAVSAVLLYNLITNNLDVIADCCHIIYLTKSFFDTDGTDLLVYCIPVIAPLFISTNNKIKIFGLFIFLSLIYTIYAYQVYLTSVWCFFAAIISSMLYIII